MLPDNAQNHTSVQASLPQVAPQSGQSKVNPVPVQQTVPSASAAEHYALQAKQLVAKYTNDPYQLSEVLSQLKSAYLSEQFHITSSKTGN